MAMGTGSNLNAVAFPALIIADDGWVDLWNGPQQVFTTSAIAKYNKRRVVLYDTRDQAWEVEGIVPSKRMGLLDKVLNRRLQVQIKVTSIADPAFPKVVAILETAIDADDDTLTQSIEASELKVAIKGADSFLALVRVLKRTGAIFS
ncbi:MAG TPA: hypothetical protein VKV30_05500 [Candidatus Angelobacter sp.]|nr:hypothetical protein [Candidatus Angelobacter sp.]